MGSDMEELSQYTWKGDTWWIVDDGECPDCGAAITSNGRVHTCVGLTDGLGDEDECQWWKPLATDEEA